MGQIVGSAFSGAGSVGKSRVATVAASLFAVAVLVAAAAQPARADLAVSYPSQTAFQSPFLFAGSSNEAVATTAFSGSKGIAASEVGNNFAVSYTTDGGKTWNNPTSVPAGSTSPNVNAPATPAQSGNINGIAIDGDNAVVSWVAQDPSFGVQVAYSSDGGKSWSSPDTVPAGAGPTPTVSRNTSDANTLVIDGNRAVLVWNNRQADGIVQVAISGDAGRNWSSPVSTPDGTPSLTSNTGNTRAPSVAISGDNIVVVANDEAPAPGAARLIRSADGGATWSKPTTPSGIPGVISAPAGIADPADDGIDPQLSLQGNRGIVTWNGRNSEGGLSVMAAYTDDGGASWRWSRGPSGTTEISPLGGVPGFIVSRSIPASVGLAGSRAVLSWNRTVGAQGRPEAAFSTDYGATWQYPTSVPAGAQSPGLAPFGDPGIARVKINSGLAAIGFYKINSDLRLSTTLFASGDLGASWQSPTQVPQGTTPGSVFSQPADTFGVGGLALNGFRGSIVSFAGPTVTPATANFALTPTCSNTTVNAAPGQLLTVPAGVTDNAGEAPQISFRSAGVASSTLNGQTFTVIAGSSGTGTVEYTATNSLGSCNTPGKITINVDDSCSKLSTASPSVSSSRNVRLDRGSFRLYGPSAGYTVQSSSKAPTTVRFKNARAKQVVLTVDGKQVGLSKSKQPKFNIDSQKLPAGIHTLSATVTPKRGKSKRATIRFRVLSCIPATVIASARARGSKGTLTFTSNSGGQPLKTVDTKLGQGIALEISKKQLGKKLGSVALTNSRSARTVLPLTVPKNLSSSQRKRGPIVLYDKSGLKVALTPGRNLRLLATGLTGKPVAVRFSLGYKKPTGVPKRCATLKLNSTMQADNNSVTTAKNTLRACS